LTRILIYFNEKTTLAHKYSALDSKQGGELGKNQ
jgi:hypothetical protein